MLNKNIETFIACDSEYSDAKIVLFGAPFDSTTSYRPGARFGSRVIRSESYGLETYSPYQNKDLTDVPTFDSGDIELCFGDSARALSDIEARAQLILKDQKIPFILGGEHLVTLGAVRAAARAHSDLRIIHFDAHADLRDDYLGCALSHACVIRRCYDILGDGKIYQFGIRSGDKSEFEWGNGRIFTQKFNFDGLRGVLRDIGIAPVYLTVDLDVFDPSVFPGTGTPEAGGVSFNMLLEAILAVCNEANIIACDVCELSPVYDQSGASAAVACKIVREMILGIGGNT